MIKMVIFDYGRTLYDREADRMFPDTVFVIRELSRQYRLGIVSYSRENEVEERIEELSKEGILDFFEDIRFTSIPENKAQKYNEVLREFDLQASEVAVVDDYVIRGIAWGNKVGATTVWFKNGKFAKVLPDKDTGQPSYIIHSLSDLVNILTGAHW